jgi:hypothetical protein
MLVECFNELVPPAAGELIRASLLNKSACLAPVLSVILFKLDLVV